jgi:hypothetical protein
VGENLEDRRQNAESKTQEPEGRSQETDLPTQSRQRWEQAGVRGQNGFAERLVSPEADSEFRMQNSKSEIQNLKSQIFEPNIYLYDKYPGGVGLSEPLFRMSASLLEKTHSLIANCPCAAGCPSCVGPVGEVGEKGKAVALEILRRISGG